ncbi:MAG: hypothetical protein WBA39_34745 [Rivularia sp. (in: cyanobacteria)]
MRKVIWIIHKFKTLVHYNILGKKNESLPTTFTPVGKQEAEYFSRVETVTSALVQYAIAQQKEVEIDGVFSYKWTASPEGRVHIEAKDGRGVLLEKDGGKLKSNMSQKDLTYFEQILPKLQPSKQNLVESESKNNQDFELV